MEQFLILIFVLLKFSEVSAAPSPFQNPANATASSIPVLGLERVCPREGCAWPWPRIFLCPWPRALCFRLHFWLHKCQKFEVEIY